MSSDELESFYEALKDFTSRTNHSDRFVEYFNESISTGKTFKNVLSIGPGLYTLNLKQVKVRVYSLDCWQCAKYVTKIFFYLLKTKHI